MEEIQQDLKWTRTLKRQLVKFWDRESIQHKKLVHRDLKSFFYSFYCKFLYILPLIQVQKLNFTIFFQKNGENNFYIKYYFNFYSLFYKYHSNWKKKKKNQMMSLHSVIIALILTKFILKTFTFFFSYFTSFHIIDIAFLLLYVREKRDFVCIVLYWIWKK